MFSSLEECASAQAIQAYLFLVSASSISGVVQY